MGVLTAIDAIHDLSPSQKWVIFSSLSYIVTVWSARKRRQWLRVLFFTLACVGTIVHHIQSDTDIVEGNERVVLLYRFVYVYGPGTVVLLFAHIPIQLAEMVIELAMVCLSVAIVYVLPNEPWVYYIMPSGIGVAAVLSLYCIGVPNLENLRQGWALTGLLLLLSAVVANIYSSQTGSMNIHGVWHMTFAMGTACLIYALRDPQLLTDYVFLEDITDV